MRSVHARTFSRLILGASTLALATVPFAAQAQETPTSSTMGQPGDSAIQNDGQAETDTTVTTQPVQAAGATQTADAAQGTVSRYPVYSGPFIDIPGNVGALNVRPCSRPTIPPGSLNRRLNSSRLAQNYTDKILPKL